VGYTAELEVAKREMMEQLATKEELATTKEELHTSQASVNSAR
jgi:hypothetical protein